VDTVSLQKSTHPFPEEVEAILSAAVNPEEVEIKPDGMCIWRCRTLPGL